MVIKLRALTRPPIFLIFLGAAVQCFDFFFFFFNLDATKQIICGNKEELNKGRKRFHATDVSCAKIIVFPQLSHPVQIQMIVLKFFFFSTSG